MVCRDIHDMHETKREDLNDRQRTQQMGVTVECW